MKTKNLAIRITLNSVIIINCVYLFMQIVTFFRDNIIFGINSLSGLFSEVGVFLGFYVIPPSIVFGLILYLVALKLQKAQQRLESGERLNDQEVEKVRRLILRFSKLVLGLNLVGFAAGYVLIMIISGRFNDLIKPEGLIVLVSNLSGGAVYAFAQTALNNKLLSPLRDMLGLHEIGNHKKEQRSTFRQLILSGLLVLYSLAFIQFNIADTVNVRSAENDAVEMFLSGRITAQELDSTYRDLLAEIFPTISNRTNIDISTLPLPWEREISASDIERNVFLLCFTFIIIMIFFVQSIVSSGLRYRLDVLKNRLKEVVSGGKDLRQRLNLQKMDEIGELTELINKMLDQFSMIVSRISRASEETEKGAVEIDKVLSRSEEISDQTGHAVLALATGIEKQAEESQKIDVILRSFHHTVSSVGEAVEIQNRFVEETSAAMLKMTSNIQRVESMTSQSGSLTEELKIKGEEGGQTAKESSIAIREIEVSASEVLEVIQVLDKIAANINLLAMNAAIEAAHAGDKGKGFAVVASEVRRLAETATIQTKAIKEILKVMSERVDRGVEKSETSIGVLKNLIKGITDSAEISGEISEAMKEQLEGTRVVAENIGNVLEASSTIKDRTEEQTRQTKEMAEAILKTVDSSAILARDSRSSAEGIHALETSFTLTKKEVGDNLNAVKSLRAEVEEFKI